LLQSLSNVALEQGFPTWGKCTPRNTLNVRNGRKTYIDIFFVFKYLFIYQWILFKKIISCLLLNILPLRHKNVVYLYSSKNLKVLKFYCIFVILLRLFVIRIWRYNRGSQRFADHVPLQHFDKWTCTPKIYYDKIFYD